MAREKDISKLEMIKDTALEIILREGLSGLKMGEIARKSGVATGTFYIYFKNKDELINALFQDTVTRARDAFAHGVHTDMTVMQVIEKLFYNCLNHYLSNPEESAFNEQYYRSPYLSEELKHNTEEYFSPILMMMQRGIDAGYLRQVDNRLIAAYAIGSIHEYAKWQSKGLIIFDEVNKRQAFEMALAGVLNPDYKGTLS